MTLKEIASRAGVSVSTVSRIINSPDGSFACKEVQDRVWGIIKETGYIPNQSARELKQGKTKDFPSGSLACFLGTNIKLEENDFFARLARTIECEAMESGYPVRTFCSSSSVQIDKGQKSLPLSDTDGAIILGPCRQREMEFLQKSHRNLVYVGCRPISARCDQIVCDEYEAGTVAMGHLISYGHKHIGYIGGVADKLRYQAYVDTLHRYGLDFSPSLVSRCSESEAGGYQGASRLLATAVPFPTAVLCSCDLIAIAAMRRFAESKMKLADQISVIGIDNIERSGYVFPMLTTVEMPVGEMGRVVVQTLINRIHKKHRLPMKIFLPNRLVIRESVSNLNSGAYI